jgi:hypothetical protein
VLQNVLCSGTLAASQVWWPTHPWKSSFPLSTAVPALDDTRPLDSVCIWILFITEYHKIFTLVKDGCVFHSRPEDRVLHWAAYPM